MSHGANCLRQDRAATATPPVAAGADSWQSGPGAAAQIADPKGSDSHPHGGAAPPVDAGRAGTAKLAHGSAAQRRARFTF